MTEETPSGYSANPASRDNWKSVDYWEKPIHKWQHEVPKMPWHSDDKPFGVSQEEWDKRSPIVKCACGNHAIVMEKYCLECWENGDDEDE